MMGPIFELIGFKKCDSGIVSALESCIFISGITCINISKASRFYF
jgi:hypothetical protein